MRRTTLNSTQSVASSTAAAARAVEIGSESDAARLARAINARNSVGDRAKAVAEFEPLELQLSELAGSATALAAKTDAQSAVDRGETKPYDPRNQAS